MSNVAFTVKSFPSWAKWAGGIVIFLLIVWAIWGEDGLGVVVGIASFFGFFVVIALLKNALR